MYMKDNLTKIIEKNPTTSSTRYCTQKSFEYKTETDELSRNKKASIQQEIENLDTTTCDLESGRVEVSHVMVFTMIDGKVCSAITNTASASTCPTCGATPKMMNELNHVRNRLTDEESVTFGLCS